MNDLNRIIEELTARKPASSDLAFESANALYAIYEAAHSAGVELQARLEIAKVYQEHELAFELIDSIEIVERIERLALSKEDAFSRLMDELETEEDSL